MNLVNYLRENKTQHLEDAVRFTAEGREDDATLSKIRANVFDIFMQTGDKTDKVFWHLQTKWKEAKKLAKAHGDDTAVTIEQIKLDVLAEIETRVRRHG